MRFRVAQIKTLWVQIDNTKSIRCRTQFPVVIHSSRSDFLLSIARARSLSLSLSLSLLSLSSPGRWSCLNSTANRSTKLVKIINNPYPSGTRTLSTSGFRCQLRITAPLACRSGLSTRPTSLRADQMRKTILEKTQQAQSQTMSLLEEKYLQKLCEKESEVRSITRKNKDLEDQIERLIFEAGEWQQEARNSENTIAALNFNLQQIYAESRDSIEGCGESEVDDTASCCDGGMAHSRQLGAVNDGVRQSTMMKCKACGVHEVKMLLLPCKHLCLCENCKSKLGFCPLCQSSKYIGLEVNMP
ncbi:probable BOI-related E3 ubiquitin-protein ligase 3 isoform X3 [Punica granatum]|uniref:Probable BOI-related E3 ubiquitin-protein ligase 3 isoform X3 n=1 Tax=Punica granatum TaxID=22663 RepID=A0A6P8C4H0_PUNGR|nr:probable BOI-related E3 ubiquitin-protein ligase 3 isoform X3 [Punica granatum]